MLCSISETSLHHKMATQRVDHFVLGVLARVPEGSGVNMHGFLSNWLHKLVVNTYKSGFFTGPTLSSTFVCRQSLLSNAT